MQSRNLMLAPIVAAVAALALTACGQREDDTTVGQQVDSAVASAERNAEQMKNEASDGLERAKEATKEAASDLRAGAGEMADKASSAVNDAAITATINAEIAKDPALSMVKINVDTADGRVALRGSAPDEAARERATELAAAVSGVVSVDNQLTIGKS